MFGVENECVVDAFIPRFPRDATCEAFGFLREAFEVVPVWDVYANLY